MKCFIREIVNITRIQNLPGPRANNLTHFAVESVTKKQPNIDNTWRSHKLLFYLIDAVAY